MKQQYTKEQMQQCIAAYQSGRSVTDLVKDFAIPRSTIYHWLKQEEIASAPLPTEVSLRNYQVLEQKVERMAGIIEILKTVDCNVKSPLQDKLDNLERLYGQYSVHMLCEALEVPRGTFYNHIFRNKRDNTCYAKRKEELRIQIQQIYADNRQIFGAQKITAILKERGIRVSERMVGQLMRDIGLASIRMDSKSNYDKEQRIYKNHLNQQFNPTRPDEIWVSDVTYFRFNNKNFYICVIIDLFARRVIAYRVGKKNSTHLVKGTFKLAYEDRKPKNDLTFHTDRGSNYRSHTFCSYLASLHVTQSFSRAHVPYDNSVVESFFSNLKREELYRTKYRSENEFRTAIDNYIIFYNERRPHARNSYKTPTKKEEEYFDKQSKQ